MRNGREPHGSGFNFKFKLWQTGASRRQSVQYVSCVCALKEAADSARGSECVCGYNYNYDEEKDGVRVGACAWASSEKGRQVCILTIRSTLAPCPVATALRKEEQMLRHESESGRARGNCLFEPRVLESSVVLARFFSSQPSVPVSVRLSPWCFFPLPLLHTLFAPGTGLGHASGKKGQSCLY